ncbi:hypothetical protein TpMuguga_02g00755 [Theileria parva strain Muguga]|uniref:Uncharacterized protein n=1 Tax=Theileria parva TaxID=5875 RepID=Q4N484_THEPA|nr:uncharacterized protein TpMuguga_02g00755 [Theileria parva strain Muguga]EAN33039.1 hypothetical protein TpMuguga_02g00755 [Theileria parva strain Muguga]|eukprot:XP_765322.1 hypothetical protein [Theileria parva strain Muguga]
MDERVVVFYHQQWLPDLEGNETFPDVGMFSVNTCREVEVVLEPHVLVLCLLRKLGKVKIIFKPCLYDRFYDGVLPAALVNKVKYIQRIPGEFENTNSDTSSDISVKINYEDNESESDYGVVRNEELVSYFVTLLNLKNNINSTELESEFSLYDTPPLSINRDVLYLKSEVVIPSYIYTHLRYAVMYLIWFHPLISHYTREVVLNSEPFPFSWYSFLRKKSQVKTECENFGYSTLENTLRDLRFFLQGIRLTLAAKLYQYSHYNTINWFEGCIFSNLTVLFSLPCQDLEDIMSLHKEFEDLKTYCIRMNARYEVVSLKTPFLSGDKVSASHFKKNSSLFNHLLNV